MKPLTGASIQSVYNMSIAEVVETESKYNK